MKINIKKSGAILVAVATVIAIVFLTGCKNDARSIWNEGLKQCSNNDLLGPNILYFGPSFSDGPGTVLVKFSSGGIGISHLANEYLDTNLLIYGASFDCNIDYAKTNGLSGSFDLSKVLSIPVSVAAKLSKAQSISVTSTNLRWVELNVGKYKELVKNGLANQQALLNDITNGQPIIEKALLVSGLSATIEFATDLSADVKASLSGGLAGSTNSDIGFSAQWQSDNKIVIAATGNFYIAGELHTWDNKGGGLAAADYMGPIVKDAGKLEFKR